MLFWGHGSSYILMLINRRWHEGESKLLESKSLSNETLKL